MDCARVSKSFVELINNDDFGGDKGEKLSFVILVVRVLQI